jgi:hypothetical protein
MAGDEDFVGELLGSRNNAALASKIYRLADSIRDKLIAEQVQARRINTAVIFFFARGFKTFQAAITLLRCGFPQDAAVLARVLREASYQARWLMKGGDEGADLFVQDYERNSRKVIHMLAEIAEPKEVRARAQDIADKIPPDDTLDEWWKNWWGKTKSIAWLADQVDSRSAYRLEYGNLSAFVHSSPALLNYYLRPQETGGAFLETRPGIVNENRQMAATTLWSIFSSFVDICKILASQLHFDFSEELAAIDADQKLFETTIKLP